MIIIIVFVYVYIGQVSCSPVDIYIYRYLAAICCGDDIMDQKIDDLSSQLKW